ncbi:MAG: hypothetical protein V7607_5658 [Solirubrobacteraceae bacterium]
MTRIGLALFSVRDELDRDLLGTLRAVAEIGYEGVELFDLHGRSAPELRVAVDRLGLATTSRHASLEAIERELPALADEARILGWRRLVLPWLDPATLDDAAWPARLARVARAASDLGLELGYHNHDAEIRTGFLERLPPDVFIELDLGWAWWAGADPVALLTRFDGRVPLVHVKDVRDRAGHSFVPVGDGAVDYEHVVPAAVEAGADWLLVEQDECQGSALAAAARSFLYLAN